VAPADPAERAREVMRETGFAWVSVIDDGDLRGWVDDEALRGADRVADAPTRKFSAYVTSGNSLRQALDSIVSSRTNVAVVVSQGQRYLGVLTLARLSEEIVSV
jgi:hypothetical protein